MPQFWIRGFPMARICGFALVLVPAVLLFAQLLLAIAVNREVFKVDISISAEVNGAQHGQVYNDTLANYYDEYSTGSSTNVSLTLLTLLVYFPVSLAGASYHKIASKSAAVLYMVGLVIALCMQQADTYIVVARISAIRGRNRVAWMVGYANDLHFTFTAGDGERYSATVSRHLHDQLYQGGDGVAALMIICLITHALFVISLVYHYFHLEVTHGPTVSKSGEEAMRWLLRSGRRGADVAWTGYRRVQHALTGRVIAVRPMNSSLLYKEVDVNDRDYQAVVHAIAAAWDIEAAQIVSIVKEGNIAFESDSDSWRLKSGDKLEFVTDDATFPIRETADEEGEGVNSLPRLTVHSLRMNDEIVA